MTTDYPKQGGCACGQVRYQIERAPMFVNCCHCTWCQRESGAAFAVNAMIESNYVTVLTGAPETVPTPSESGSGQTFIRCPTCRVALWSYYRSAKDKISFIRVGTLDYPHGIEPDIHIYTSTKQPWVQIPEHVPQVEAYYSTREYWPEESLKRREKALG